MFFKLKGIILVCFIFIFIEISECQLKPKCSTKETCGSCIQELGCVWCNIPISESTNKNFRRCMNIDDSNLSNWCKKENIINPKTGGTILQQIPLQISDGSGAVQITPQKVRLVLRRGQEYKLNFKYAQAEDYPVDLYYIMDLSASMDAHRDKLSRLGTKLADTMRKLTRNFRLGFGSFVDKVEMPYTSTTPEKLKSPCVKNNVKCAPPYSYKNHLSLTEKEEIFSKQVKSARVSGNLDFPEGGLDALMQAIVCQEEIGWRQKARHLLVFSTDATFHIAGDGKLGGIVEPNDGKCHMENNSYTHGLLLDYPSIGQINAKAIEHNINLIFAVEESQIKIYNLLKERIEGASIGILSNDTSNVVDLVKGVYDQLVDSVTISDDSDSDIEVKYYSSCRNGTLEETKECGNLRIGVEVDFTAVIKVLDCPKDGNITKTFQIKPGALNESLTVEIEILCKCDCEKTGNTGFKPNAVECSRAGNLQCGICDCLPGKFGSKCECDGQNLTAIEDYSNCRLGNSTEICSGLGTCKCNTCDCQKRADEKELIYGKYCECNNYSCKRNSGQICSGVNRGKCECGKCICFAGWSGEACECSEDNSKCLAPNSKNSELCSGRGDCICGQCECKVVDGHRYSGQFCNECPSCPAQRCDEFRHCVECLTYQTGIYNKMECAQHCTKFTVEIVEEIEEELLGSEEKFCRYPDNTGCNFKFQYSYDDYNTLSILAQREKICTQNVNIMAVVWGVIGSILLAGIILLLIWKCFTTIHDRKEYAKFETERKNAKWNREDNPLFKSPMSNFQNPIFNAD